MRAIVSAKNFGGELPAIASKSYAHRLLICAALSQNPSFIACKTRSDDILATAGCLRALGAKIEESEAGFAVTPIRETPKKATLNCCESGSTLRFMLPIVCALGGEYELHMEGKLPQRPLSPLYEELVAHGAVLSEQGITPLKTAGRLRGNHFKIPAGVSSQFISGLLLALPILDGGTVELLGKVESGSYIDITVQCLQKAGIAVTKDENTYSVAGQYKLPSQAEAEGDWSNAAFWLCAGAIGASPVTVTGLNKNSAQGDREIVNIIKRFGANVTQSENAVTVAPGSLVGIDVDAGDIPDLVPIISAMAACAAGTTKIYNAARLRLKESDRLEATADILSRLSVDITQTDDGLTIKGGEPLCGGVVDSWNDHRIAMTAAVAAIAAKGSVTIENAQSAAKSYPDFFEDFRRLGGKVTKE